MIFDHSFILVEQNSMITMFLRQTLQKGYELFLRFIVNLIALLLEERLFLRIFTIDILLHALQIFLHESLLSLKQGEGYLMVSLRRQFHDTQKNADYKKLLFNN